MKTSSSRRSAAAGLALSTLLLALLACGGGGSGSGSGSAGGSSSAGTSVSLILPPADAGETFWVACQDGTGPWKAVPPAGNTYTFNVTDPAGRYGLALVDVYPDGSGLTTYGRIEHFTTSEVRSIDFSAWAPYSTVGLSGGVTGLNANDGAKVRVGYRTAILPPGTLSFALNAKVGTSDVIAARLAGNHAADALVVYRNFPASTPGSLPTFDFASGWALTPSIIPAPEITATESLTLTANWLTKSSFMTLATSSTGPFIFNSVPPARMIPGELHALIAQANDTTQGTQRFTMCYVVDGSGAALNLPAAQSVPTFGQAATAPYLRPTATWTVLPAALVHDFYTTAVNTSLFWDVHISKGWLGGTSTPTYAFPDFSGIGGWNNAWAYASGQTIAWNLGSRGATYQDPGYYYQGPRSYVAGNTAWETYRQGSLSTVPAAPKASESLAVGLDERQTARPQWHPARR